MPGQTLGRTLAEGVLRVIGALVVLTLLGLVLDLGLRLPSYLWGAWCWAGILPVALGIGLEVWGTLAFWKYGGGTPHPGARPERLVLQGPYAFSRNPLYLGRFSILLGASILLGSPGIFVVLVGLILFVQFALLPREEQRLEARHGAAYNEYSSRVGRWITLPGIRGRV
jgi:protein-S-isoprenylcysteine O-methyltransferase Ste14